MPSVTGKQARFMAGCRHNPEAMHGKCPPAKVSREFNEADKGTGKLARAAKHLLRKVKTH